MNISTSLLLVQYNLQTWIQDSLLQDQDLLIQDQDQDQEQDSEVPRPRPRL